MIPNTSLATPRFCRVCGVPLNDDASDIDMCTGCRTQRALAEMKQCIAAGPSGWKQLASMLFEEEEDMATAKMQTTAKKMAECLIHQAEGGSCPEQCPLLARIAGWGFS